MYKLKVGAYIEIPDNYDRLCSKGLDDRVWYALYGNEVIVIKNGRQRKVTISDECLSKRFRIRYNFEKRELIDGKHEWDSFFDTSTGERIESYEQMKSHEKAGKVFLTHDEASREAKKNREHIDKKYKEGENKRFREAIIPVLKKQGIL